MKQAIPEINIETPVCVQRLPVRNRTQTGRFLEIAIGSVLECAACLDVMFDRQIISIDLSACNAQADKV